MTGDLTGALLSNVPNAFKVQPGMTLLDLGPGGIECPDPPPNTPRTVPQVDNISAAPNIHITCGPGVTVSGSIGSSPEAIQFSGCGYHGDPADAVHPEDGPKPWLGNCVATAFLFQGTDSTKGGVGTACDYLQSHGWRAYMHMNNGQETVCSKMIFDSGSGAISTALDSDEADPTSIGIWVEGDGNKIELAQGKTNARTGFLNASNHQPDALGFTNFNFANGTPNSVIFANAGSANLTQLKGSAVGVGYADSSEENLTLTANEYPGLTLYYDDPGKLPAVHCANNVLATSFCGNLLTHTAAGGLTPVVTGDAVIGNDGAGRVVFTATPGALNFVMTFATPWASPPVCFAQDETNINRNPVIASSVTPTSVTFKTANPGGFVVGDFISYQCTGSK